MSARPRRERRGSPAAGGTAEQKRASPRPAASRLAWPVAGGAVAAILLAAVAILVLSGGPQRAERTLSATSPAATAPTGAARALAPTPGATQPPAPTPGAIVVGREAPDFVARLIDGGSFSLSARRGTPVLILFTASWCAPCIPEVNKMAQLHEVYGARGLEQLVLSIDPQDTDAEFDGLRRKTRGGNLLWGLDVNQRALRGYQIRAVDTKVLVDRDGRIAFISIGPTAYETLEQAVARTQP